MARTINVRHREKSVIPYKQHVTHGFEPLVLSIDVVLRCPQRWAASVAARCPVPALMEAPNSREDESHGGTEERLRRAPGAGQGPCKVVRQAADLLGCWRREAAVRCR